MPMRSLMVLMAKSIWVREGVVEGDDVADPGSERLAAACPW